MHLFASFSPSQFACKCESFDRCLLFSRLKKLDVKEKKRLCYGMPSMSTEKERLKQQTKMKMKLKMMFSINSTHQTMPCAPDPIGFKFWYRLCIVNFVSPTSTVYNAWRVLIMNLQLIIYWPQCAASGVSLSKESIVWNLDRDDSSFLCARCAPRAVLTIMRTMPLSAKCVHLYSKHLKNGRRRENVSIFSVWNR